MNELNGFLVVLAPGQEGTTGRRNSRYRGLSRIPSYPSKYDGENPVLDRYVFELRDDNGLIPTLSIAKDLQRALAAQSPRQFEILRTAMMRGDDTPHPSTGHFLGFDVTTSKGEFWSIVKDFPSDATVDSFANRLNDNGLFSDMGDAFDYLAEYQQRRFPDYDMPFAVFSAELVDREPIM
jgi:hypothetical protein